MRYTSSQNIKKIKDYIDLVLPAQNRSLMNKIVQEAGYDVFLQGSVYKNVQEYRNWLWKQMIKTAPEIYTEIQKLDHMGPSMYSQNIEELFQGFVNINYKDEAAVLWTDIEVIGQKLNGINGFTRLFNIDPIYIHEILESENLDELLLQKYDKKHVPKELLDRTQKVKKNIDDFYQGFDYSIFNNAMRTYIINKDEIELHNLLNKPM
jgi:hypothetical protein